MAPLIRTMFMTNGYSQSIIFGAGEVAKITSLSVAQVAQIGQFIKPHLPANGKGYRMGYSFRNIVEIHIVNYLIKFGVPRKRIQNYLNDLSGSRFGWLEEDGQVGWIILDDQWRWSAGPTPNEALQNIIASSPVHASVTLDVGLIKDEVRKKIEECGGWKDGRSNSGTNVTERALSVS